MKPQENIEKIFVDANRLLNDAFLLGELILDSGFEPNLLIAVWRGGTPVGIAIQELLTYKGIEHQHYPVKTRHYAGIEQRHEEILVEGLEPILTQIDEDSRILIVDDVFDTGLTLDQLATQIQRQSPVNAEQLRLAAPWFKPANNRTERQPDYFLHQTDFWIVFPHELQGLEKQEILQGKPELPALKAL